MALEQTPLDLNTLSMPVQKIVGPAAPGPAKMMAAKGLAPMGPQDLVTAIYQLTHDADAKIAQAAVVTANRLPEKILAGALGEALDPRVIDFFSSRLTDKSALLEKVLLNPVTADETFVTLGRTLPDRELEILAGNQTRLLRHPAIIEAIYFNRSARMSTVNRLLELAVRHGLVLEGIPQFKQIVASIMQSGAAGEEEAQVLEGAEADAAFEQVLATADEVEDGDEPVELPRAANIRMLPVASRIRLASLGNAGHRAVLIKDTNRGVAMAAVSSPAVAEPEAVRWASQRELSEDVIRYIATRKEWHKNYAFKLNLINNPKCPLRISMGLIVQLRANDLRALSRSKNVPGPLAKAAKQRMQVRR